MNKVLNKLKEIFKPKVLVIIFSLLLSVFTFLTISITDNSKNIINYDIELNYINNSSIKINEILVNNMPYYDDGKYTEYYTNDAYYFKDLNKIELSLTNNDSLEIIVDKEYINNIKNINDYYAVTNDSSVTLSKVNTKENVIVDSMNNNKNKVLIVLFSFVINYVLLCVINYYLESFKNNKLRWYSYIISVLALFFVYWFNFYSMLFLSKYIVFGFIILGLILSILKLTSFKFTKENIGKVCALIIILTGTSMVYIYPTASGLDELNHFHRAYSNLIYIEKDPFDNYKEPIKFFSKNLNNLLIHSNYGYNEKDIKQNQVYLLEYRHKLVNYKEYSSVLTPIYGTKSAARLDYIPASIVAFICKRINTPVLLMALLMRFINIALFTYICFKAIKLMPRYKNVFMLMMVLPISIQQASIVNQDWLNNALFFYMVAYIFNLIYNDSKLFSKKDYIILLLLTIGLIRSKTVYFITIFLILLIDNKKFKKPAKEKVSLLVISCILFALSYLGYFNKLYDILANNKIYIAGNNLPNYYTIPYALNHPTEIIIIYIRTFARNCTYFFLGGLYDGFGWSKLHILEVLGQGLGFILLILLLSQPYEKDTVRNKVGYLLFSIVLYIIVCASMLFGWTTIGNTHIQGLQSRYFIPVALFVYIFLNNNKIKLEIKNYNILLSTMMIIFVSIALFTIVSGYYI